MMKRLKYSIFLILSVFMGLTSCKKSKQLKPDEIPDPQPTETKHYIPVKFEAPDFTLNLRYMENTGLLTEITDSDDHKTVITYKNGQLYKLEKYRNEALYYIVYYQQNDHKVTDKALLFDYNDFSNTYSPRGFYTITYNEERKISTFHYYDNANKLTGTAALSYAGSKNLSAVNITEFPGSGLITRYTFDQRKGISNYVINSELLVSELEYWFFLCTNNNMISALNEKSPQENISFTYEYDGNGYPSTMKLIDNKNTQHIKITYKTLDL